MASDQFIAGRPLDSASLALPVACSLSAEDRGRRGGELAALFAGVVGAQEYSDGYGFAFPAESSQARQLLDFILFERECCPFFTFALTFLSPHKLVWLDIRGSAEAKDTLKSAYDTALAHASE